MERLDGRTTLVTGGGGGLGRLVVKRFVEAGASVHVPVFEGEREALEEVLGDGIAAVHLREGVDLTDAVKVAELFGTIEAEAGEGVEILLNLAGGFSAAPIEETDPGSWQRLIQMNATTVFLCSRAAFGGMRSRGFGRIVNVSALPALEGGGAGMAAYAASKAAVLQLTRSLAKEGAALGVTVNAVLPSIIDTPGNRAAMPEADRSRWVPPFRIAEVMHFLASDAGGIVNGAALPLTLGEP